MSCNDQKTGPLDNLTDSMRYFRALGFFSEEAKWSDADLAQSIVGEK